MKKILISTATILVLLITATFSHAGYTWEQLTSDTYDDIKPQINIAGDVVYEKHIGYESAIYLHAGGAEKHISSGFSHNYNPQINAGGYVIWETNDNGSHRIFNYGPNYIRRNLPL